MNRLQHALDYAHARKRNSRFVYILKCQHLYKVGVASNVGSRVRNLQIGNPFKIELIARWQSVNATSEESDIHALLRRYHVRGEWFELPSSLVADLIRGKD